ncbi:hypothetical protein BpHYR1_046517 [Brachionus plicatilis]|uniref:Uncharacterized protein n=1 Tax=Brachionus plicatilis TaxID=10195 RepID=A0A3M7T606_BRAPC|nr:hypothetical protein BpHYR1_046517 [Brachionus plicatilis]
MPRMSAIPKFTKEFNLFVVKVKETDEQINKTKCPKFKYLNLIKNGQKRKAEILYHEKKESY